jgi:hypothetical protein
MRDDAVILAQRGAIAAFYRDAPMADRSKTEVLCRANGFITGRI